MIDTPSTDTSTHAAVETPNGMCTTAPAADGTGSGAAGLVTARELTKRFGDTEVVRRLDLDIEPGTILGLIGPSGSGKTTTVRLLTGLLAPDCGRATVFDTPATELSGAERARIGYLPQVPALFPELSLAENLSFHASMYGLPFRRRERMDQLLDWVELGEHRRKRVADASGGMQRRLALAAALVHDPEVVFLDEPTAGIDPILRERLWERFRQRASKGATLVVTTQYVGEAGQCDYVGLLSDGELVLLDTPERLRRAAFGGEVADVRTSRPLSDAELASFVGARFVCGEPERVGPSTIRFAVDDLDAAGDAIRSAMTEVGVEVVEIDEHLVDYDEAFVRVVQRHRGRHDVPEDEEPATVPAAAGDGADGEAV